jgi:hypothetical protein
LLPDLAVELTLKSSRDKQPTGFSFPCRKVACLNPVAGYVPRSRAGNNLREGCTDRDKRFFRSSVVPPPAAWWSIGKKAKRKEKGEEDGTDAV